MYRAMLLPPSLLFSSILFTRTFIATFHSQFMIFFNYKSPHLLISFSLTHYKQTLHRTANRWWRWFTDTSWTRLKFWQNANSICSTYTFFSSSLSKSYTGRRRTFTGAGRNSFYIPPWCCCCQRHILEPCSGIWIEFAKAKHSFVHLSLRRLEREKERRREIIFIC